MLFQNELYRSGSFYFKVENFSKYQRLPKFHAESEIYRAFGVDWSLCFDVYMSEKGTNKTNWEVNVYLNFVNIDSRRINRNPYEEFKLF